MHPACRIQIKFKIIGKIKIKALLPFHRFNKFFTWKSRSLYTNALALVPTIYLIISLKNCKCEKREFRGLDSKMHFDEPIIDSNPCHLSGWIKFKKELVILRKILSP